jgi:hypothetical protein
MRSIESRKNAAIDAKHHEQHLCSCAAKDAAHEIHAHQLYAHEIHAHIIDAQESCAAVQRIDAAHD